jgi:hypothetical protein
MGFVLPAICLILIPKYWFPTYNEANLPIATQLKQKDSHLLTTNTVSGIKSSSEIATFPRR